MLAIWEAAQRALHEVRVIRKLLPTHQVRLPPRLAQVIVEAARPRVRPSENCLDARQPLIFFGKPAQLGKTPLSAKADC